MRIFQQLSPAVAGVLVFLSGGANGFVSSTIRASSMRCGPYSNPLAAASEASVSPVQSSADGQTEDLPQALIFDCDGVLADTERDGHRPAFNAAFKIKNLGECSCFACPARMLYVVVQPWDVPPGCATIAPHCTEVVSSTNEGTSVQC